MSACRQVVKLFAFLGKKKKTVDVFSAEISNFYLYEIAVRSFPSARKSFSNKQIQILCT